jgi:acetylornithine deacetylase
MDLLKPSTKSDIPSDALSLLFVVGEETSGDGMKHFSKNAPHNYSAVIFGEPTEGKLTCGHKGIMMFNLEVTGKAAHSGYPWLGISANNLLHEALGAMLALESKLPRSDKYGHSTLNVGRIDGGVAANVVAEGAKAELSIRLANGTPDEVQDLIRKALHHVQKRAEANGGKVDVVFFGNGYPPQNMLCDVEGFDKLTVNYGTDVPNLQGTHDRYLYGPGTIFVAHGPDEHIKKSELQEAVGKYKTLIFHALAKDA